MTFPSATLLAQSALSGLFVGALYGLLGLGLSLSWGLLRQINLAHFALAFLAAYLCYQMSAVGHVDPIVTLAVIVPLCFVIGVAAQWLFARFAITPFNSLLVTFGLTVMLESAIQWIWTADFRKLESVYGDTQFRIGVLYVPAPELMTLVVALVLSLGVWAGLRFTDAGRALRAAAEDGPIAEAFGIDRRGLGLVLAGIGAATAGIGGVCLALSHTLAPAQIYAWIGVVFAAVMMGGLGRALGPLVAGIVIGVSESLAMAITAPSWAPLVSFSLLLVVLLVRPDKF